METRVGSCWQSSGEDGVFSRLREGFQPYFGDLRSHELCRGNWKGTERERKKENVYKKQQHPILI